MKYYAPLLLLFILLQCTTDDTTENNAVSTEQLLIQSYKAPCSGLIDQECYLVKIGADYPNGEWTYFHSQIEGFEYAPGFVYAIEIQKTERNPLPQDVSMYRYVFQRLISKERAD